MHLARRATPKVAHIGGVLAVIGLATLPGLLVTDYYDLALAQGLPRAAVGARSPTTPQSSWAAAVMLATDDRADVLRPRDADGRRLPRRRGASSGRRSRSPSAGCCRSRPAPGSSRPPRARVLIGVALIPIGVRAARMSDQAWAERPAGRVRTRRDEGAEDGGRERRLTGEMAGVRLAGARLGHPGGLEQLAPRRVPPVHARPGRPRDGTGRPTRGGRRGSPPRGRLAAVRRPPSRPAAARCRPRSSAARGRPAGACRAPGRRRSPRSAPR